MHVLVIKKDVCLLIHVYNTVHDKRCPYSNLNRFVDTGKI